ncbi:MAG: hypothetical protein Q9167_004938, partial [Letrouitia subvulpina]
ALTTYIYLFARLYPCGECAAHFQALLKSFPPQVSSRKAAEMWGCHVHNQVNRRLKKVEFDCARVGEAYDCGCGEEGKEEGGEEKGEEKKMMMKKKKKKKGEKDGDEDIRVEVERMG